MTKPVTGMAAMILVDDGRLALWREVQLMHLQLSAIQAARLIPVACRSGR